MRTYLFLISNLDIVIRFADVIQGESVGVTQLAKV